ncbi:hypothetical protein SMQE22_43470 [Serratia marcescens]|nr:hypothetical protein SMQE22_43470 [Serratia marcescens]
MKKIFLVLIVFLGGINVASSANFEAIPRIEPVSGSSAFLSFTFLRILPESQEPNPCYGQRNCMLSVVMTLSNSPRVSVALAEANSSCNTADCKTSTSTAKTMGELAPLVRYLGRNGTNSTRDINQIGNWPLRLCFGVAINGNWGGPFGCSPEIPRTNSCDILDTNAIVDFGSFSSDVTARQATGSIKINCASEAYLRVKFNSNVTNMSLSQDGRMSASLKFRDLIAGVGENYVKVPGGNREIYIDGELRNNNTSHTGPFSVPVVAIIEII